MTRVLSLLTSGMILGIVGIAPAQEEGTQPVSKQQAKSFEKEITVTFTAKLNYLLYVPPHAKEGDKLPLILFLHGAGERGSNLDAVKTHGIPKIVESKEDFPFIVVSPQCPRSSWWTAQVDALNALLDEVIANNPVDTDRIYLTGLSMGGFGAWALAAAYPERFAAVAPICGGGDPADAKVLKNIPIWVFHGAKDPIVPPRASEEMVEAIRAEGGDVRFTLYPDAEHDSWTETYNNPELYTWFLSHSLKERSAK